MGGELPYSKTSRLNHTTHYLKLLHRLTPARSLSRGLGRAPSYHKVCTRRSLEQSHHDAPSCAHLRATWCMKDRQPEHNQVLKNPYKDMHVINIHAAHMPCMNSRYHRNSLQSIHFIDNSHRVHTEITSM